MNLCVEYHIVSVGPLVALRQKRSEHHVDNHLYSWVRMTCEVNVSTFVYRIEMMRTPLRRIR
jgi:hypothetical protein